MRRIFYTLTLAFVAFIYLIAILGQTATAIGISPPGIEAGTLNSSGSNTYSFQLKNLNPSYYNINVTFELTPGSKYLLPYVSFSPPSAIIYPDNKTLDFSVTIGGSVSAGDHLLVFVPKPNLAENPEHNSSGSGNIDASGIVIDTAAAYIEFTKSAIIVPPVPPAPSSSSSGGGSSGGGAALPVQPKDRKSNATIVVVTEYTGLIIEAPRLVKAADPSVTIKIKLKNTGNVNLSLLMNITGNPPLSLKYDPGIGGVFSGEQKEVEVTISNFSSAEHLIRVAVTDADLEKTWSAAFNVVVPEKPRGMSDKNCIEYRPANYDVVADRKSGISMNIKNNCNITLHNLNIIVSSLDYREYVRELYANETRTVDMYFTLKEGTSKHTLIFEYDEGETVGEIIIVSAASYMNNILKFGAFLLVLAALLIMFMFARKNRRAISAEVKMPPELKSRIDKLKTEITSTEDIVSRLSAKKGALETKIVQLTSAVREEEDTAKQLSSYLKSISSSIGEKKKSFESLKSEENLKDSGKLKIKFQFELAQLERSIDSKKEILKSLDAKQKSLSAEDSDVEKVLSKLKSYFGPASAEPERSVGKISLKKEECADKRRQEIVTIKEHITAGIKPSIEHYERPPEIREELSLRNTMDQLRVSIGVEKKTVESLKKEETMLKVRVTPKNIWAIILENLKACVEEEKKIFELMKSKKESIHQNKESHKERLVTYQEHLYTMKGVNTVEKLTEKKDSLNDALLALERLYDDKIISKEIYDSRGIVKLELEAIDKKIRDRLEEMKVIKKEAERILGRVP